jgi:FkbM family methyltransferase
MLLAARFALYRTACPAKAEWRASRYGLSISGGWGTIRDKFGNAMLLPSLREPISLGIFGSGIYEPNTLATILSYLPPTGVFLDVGANIGAIALPVAAQSQARIVCVEADARIACILRQNALSNRRDITIIECIAGAENCSALFYRAPIEKFGMGSVGPQFTTFCDTLQQRRLDDLLDEQRIDHVDVVKLDIEGAEYGALRGLRRRLSAPRAPVVIFEFADWAETRIAGQAAGSAQKLLLAHDYKLFELRPRGKRRSLARPLTSGAAMILALPATQV